MGHLLDQTISEFTTICDDGSIKVGQQGHRRDRGRHGSGHFAQVIDRRLHMNRVEGPRDRQREESGTRRRLGRESFELFDGACGYDLAFAIVVGWGEPSGLNGGQHLVGIAPDDSSHGGGSA